MRGLFITFEGGDGSGKSTQMRLVAERLRAEGHEVLETVEPGGTRIGTQVRRILLDSANQELCPTAELLLYFAARAQNVDEFILPAVQAGKIVLSDRFTDSSLAYQGAARGLGEDTVLALDRIACRGLKPDLTLVVDVAVETGLERAGVRNRELGGRAETRMDEQTAGFHHKVRAAYHRLAQLEPRRVRLVDGSRDVETVSRAVWGVVGPLLERLRVR